MMRGLSVSYTGTWSSYINISTESKQYASALHEQNAISITSYVIKPAWLMLKAQVSKPRTLNAVVFAAAASRTRVRDSV